DLALERSPGATLFLQVSNRLDSERNSFTKDLDSQIPKGTEEQLKKLDETSLAENDGARVYVLRLDFYSRAARILTQKRFADLDRSKLISELDALERERGKLLNDLAGYSGPLANEVSNVCHFIINRGFETQVGVFGKRYVQVLKDDLDRMSAFPLARNS